MSLVWSIIDQYVHAIQRIQSWANVTDDGPALKQHCVNVSCLEYYCPECAHFSKNSVLGQRHRRWPTLKQHCDNVSCLVYYWPVCARCSENAVLGQRYRRWANIKTTLCHCLLFGILLTSMCTLFKKHSPGPTLQTVGQQWTSIVTMSLVWNIIDQSVHAI